MQDGEGFDPTTGNTVRHDKGFKRVIRGFMAQKPKYLMFSIFNIFYTLGALALAGLGAYSAITVLSDAYAKNITTSFVCKSPLDG
jgi:hypothetical protein